MGTLGKALGASGGYICGSRALIEFLIHRARSFIFSTAPVPAAAAAATAAIQLLLSATGAALRQTLWDRIKAVQAVNQVLWFRDGAILPVLVGDEERAVAISAQLREDGYFVPAIRYPTVARGAARLRVTLTAAHAEAEVTDLAQRLEPVAAKQSVLRDA
jgi:7-keto-8-aminopelargonate synthetase-like enzyme